jgi:hypothetical protein
VIEVRPVDRTVRLGPSTQGQIPGANQHEVAVEPPARSGAQEVDRGGEPGIRTKGLPHRRNGDNSAFDPGMNISSPRRLCLTRPEAASTCNRPHPAFAYCGLSMIRAMAGLRGWPWLPAPLAGATTASAGNPEHSERDRVTAASHGPPLPQPGSGSGRGL